MRSNDGSAPSPVTADTLCPPGTCLVVQGASVRVGGPLDLQARGSLLGLQHVRSSAPMLNAASYMRILEGEFPEGSKVTVDAREGSDALEFRKD